MSNNLPDFIWSRIDEITEQRANSNFLNRAKQLNKKLQKLRSDVDAQTSVPSDNIINRSKIRLTKEEVKVLSQGLKSYFSFSENAEDYIVDIENSIYHLPNQEKMEIRKLFLPVLSQINNKKGQNRVAKNHLEVVNNLKKKGVIITKSDKGNKIVILDKADYRDVIKYISDLFEPLKRNPIESSKKEPKKAITSRVKTGI